MFKHFLKGLFLLGCAVSAIPGYADSANRTTSPSPDKFYRIISAAINFYPTNGTPVEKMMYANDNNNIAWKTNNAEDLSGIWRFTPGDSEGTFYMQNAKTLDYPSVQSSNDDSFVLVGKKTPVTITSLSDVNHPDDTNQVNISNTQNMHAGGWQNNNIATSSGDIIAWPSGFNSPSAWYIESISNEEIEALTAYYKSQKDYYLSLISHFSATNQAKFADAVAIINNDASTAFQLNEAYTTIKHNASSVVSFIPVTKESMLQTGGQYVIGVVGTSTTNWTPINPFCYKSNNTGTDFDFVSKPDGKFTPDVIWTATVDNSGSHVCIMAAAAHDGPHKVLQLSQDFNGTPKAIKINGTANKVLANLSDEATYIEFVPITNTAFPDELLFQFHTFWSNYSGRNQFAKIHAVNHTGGMGWYTRNYNETWNTDLIGSNSNDFSGLHRVYLVIDSEHLQASAEVIWNMLKEEECNNSESEDYCAQVNALPLPDLSDFNDASTLIDDLTKEFKHKLFSLDADFTAHITPETVIYSNAATSWNNLLTDTKGGFVKITSHLNASNTSNVANNMKKINATTFDFRNGTNHNSLYEFECFNPAFSIIGISFYASTSASGEYVTVDGEDILLTSTAQKIISTSPSIIFHGGNNQVNVSDLTIKYRTSSTPSVVPNESGWYSILYTHHTTAGANTIADGYVGKWTINHERDLNQNNTNFYSLGVSDDFSAAPASNLVYITVNGNNRIVKSSNGHIVKDNCAADRSGTYNTVFTAPSTEPAPGTIIIGSYWNTFEHTVDGVKYQLIGKGSSSGHNRWAVFKENPEDLYDIWTVHVTGAPNAHYIQDDVRVQCTHAANKGLSRVYNNGNFFITKGTTLSTNDIVVDRDYTDNLNTLVTVNNTTKVIKVDYLTKEAYLETVYHSVVNNNYLPYGDVCIFDNDKVTEVITNHIEEINEAASNDSGKLSDETLTALNNLVSPDNLIEGFKEIRRTAYGKLVQFRNLDHNNLYLSFEQTNNDCHAHGQTDNTSLNTLWKIELASEDDATIYLKNYGSGLWMRNHIRNNGGEANIPLSESNPADWVIEAYYNGTNHTPIVGLKDTESTLHEYLHQTTNNNNRLVKWSSPSAPSFAAASGWTVTLAEDDTLSDDFNLGFSKDATDGSQYMTLTHNDGVSLHAAYHNDHHSIVIRKSSNVQQVKSRADEDTNDTENILITPDKLTYNEETHSVSFPINENGLLEDGSAYEALIPAGLLKIGNNKLSKATTASFRYSNNGTVDIVEIQTPDSVNIIYDLQGRRLAAPIKGINIINGHKTFIR